MKVEHTEITDRSYFSLSGRMAALIEEALHRGRKIIAVTTAGSDSGHYYGSLFWTLGEPE